MRRIDYFILVFLILNTLLLAVSLIQNKERNKNFLPENKVSEAIESSDAVKGFNTVSNNQKVEQLNRSISQLLVETSDLKFKLGKIEKALSKSQYLETVTQSNHEESVNEQLKAKYELNDQKAESYIDELFSAGVMNQNDVHTLRQRMVNMSPEAHDRELQRIIMALNRGDIELPPGVIF
ncbi:hypothetical protein [Pleionea sediminis]|uniref:hypothetical protein n=1 Tax=Pleionea sediminis TaxID=2569479 RepID=UPI0011852898|nr:hypothetical protein [Pleionea sediminis]